MANTSITLTLEQVAGQLKALPTVEVRPWYQYVDGKRTDNRLGTVYVVLQPLEQLKRLSVKVADSPVVSQQQLDDLNKELQFQLLKFEGFSARFYTDRNGEIQISGRAEKAILVRDGAAK